MYKRELDSVVTALSVLQWEQVSLLFSSQAESILKVPWKKGLISTRSPPAGAGVVGTPRYIWTIQRHQLPQPVISMHHSDSQSCNHCN